MPGSSNDLASLIEDADHDKPAVLALSEEALNEAFRPGYKPLCHVEVCKLADIARSALRLPPSVPPTEVRILNAGSFDKVFIIRFNSIATVARVPFDVPAARDPIRLRSQIATLDFLKTHKPTIPLPRVLTAVADSDDPLRAPYVVSEFCRGTPLTIQEWYVDMSDASRDAAIELLADNWVKIVTPISFQSMGSIVRDPARPSGFRVMPMISQFPGQATPLLDPSVAMLDGHKSLGDYWTLTMEGHRRQIVDFWPDNDHSVVVLDLRYEKYTLGHLWQCYEAILELVHIAASLDPLADAPAMALMHADYFFWKNILFSADRTRIEGIID
ncbi:uncharacterized protein B0H18DRAFT_1102801 [Fomitopsis serialis]|uniref:uncharacterized protein n=1 Tax=Fomitopsis serialis TaxID=139415 RepID=UPI00200732B6|nr:uncharacterized protein B0H18DRAFT_1102801 [Neoantrodia serialis]KAH9931337.1 hypothetical protein B0H18DRAFT_1102801 [Neoantrodia serialis]